MTVEIARDRYGRPLITPPGGGKPVPYYRASSFGGVLDDTSNLEKWKQRIIIHGLTKRPDLVLRASTLTLEDKWKLNQIAEQAFEAAGGSKAANEGTSLHALTEMLDRGQKLPRYPAEHKPALEAYFRSTRGFDHTHIEQFMVCDELQVAGTPDRLSREFTDVDTRLKVTDLKTNAGGLSYSGLKYSIQMAIYAHSVFYDPETGARTPPKSINQEHGVIFWMPNGGSTCDLYDVDLERGWQLALLAAEVRQARKMKGLLVERVQQQAAA